MMNPPKDTTDTGIRTSDDVTAAFYAGARAMRATLNPEDQTTWPEGWGADPGPLDLGHAPAEPR